MIIHESVLYGAYCAVLCIYTYVNGEKLKLFQAIIINSLLRDRVERKRKFFRWKTIFFALMPLAFITLSRKEMRNV